jgi:two-component system, response regulator YesN
MAQKKSPQKISPLEDNRINWRAFGYYSSLNRIRSHWWEHRGESISLTEAASLAAMTPTYFSRFFHEKTGVTFKYWIDFMRVEHAMSLIHSTNITIIELLDRCGFRDATTFTRTFRRITGITPLEFKRTLRTI